MPHQDLLSANGTRVKGVVLLVTCVSFSLSAMDPLLINSSKEELLIDENESMALHQAAKSGNAELVSELLSQHETSSGLFKTPYIDLTSKDGNAALHVAAYYGHSDCVAVLLEHKANIKVNTGTITYKEREPIRLGTPLFFAIFKDHADVVEQLFNAGADPKSTSPHGNASPLKMAVAENSTKTVTYLVTQKLDDLKKERLLLDFARVHKGGHTMMRLLISLNPEAFVVMWDKNLSEVAIDKLLKTHTCSESSLHYAAKDGDKEACETLLEGFLCYALHHHWLQKFSYLSLALLGIELPLKFETFLVDLKRGTQLSTEDFITVIRRATTNWMRDICGLKDSSSKTAADYVSDNDDLHEMLNPENCKKTLPLLIGKWLEEQQARAEE